ncbi:tRNA uridine-5-carboxymethylaminomethyl(34) synthesis GTPase MnmE [Robiginitalea sp. SC105]|uniref:tRNA uridine-5-carboxymethylaminomethyl(34) synthesis GTPase MnmE n=1 Tax=Robiginitalea sp. SC105 TaxID=2762332 RepID=UPI0016398514|nr:tRNA uridine-5-carboxymethylaminomethyl(34) synthesis GTPase MnmE [Robiginitalea sp. SC105]MBC2840353.1 tRNA uridine-5-carboxymethylaminomethyl(34) synthesis GTPase MnmE [Robiginitalea sp. SC105]
MMEKDTIIALATPAGSGAIAVLRLSGAEAIAIAAEKFQAASGNLLSECPGHTVHLGTINKGGRILDQVLATVFRSPRSYTGEDVVEISCHGSIYIQREILNLFLDSGCRMAKPGEFTLRAFINGKMDLSQAEAVADLIASENKASHQIALQQMRGGYSTEIARLREELLNFASLITLELDFSGEDVEFADRGAFYELLDRLGELLKDLIDSFALGNVLKKGIPVAIAGAPNVGKSTLLNALLKEERAIVSEIAGTTRDAIEDEIVLEGIGFRFIDTAGIRETSDQVEHIGIQKTFEKMETARVIIYMVDGSRTDPAHFASWKAETDTLRERHPDKPIIHLINKTDQLGDQARKQLAEAFPNALGISARTGEGLEQLQAALLGLVNRGLLENNDPVVSNSRHYQALVKAQEAIGNVREGMESDVPSDLVSVDINEALHHLGEITGQISTDDLLGNIFSNFCIGK